MSFRRKFAIEPDPELLCTKCHEVLVGPVIDNCGHNYCEVCLVAQKMDVGFCVISEQPLTHYIRPKSAFIDRINSLQVLCSCGKGYGPYSEDYPECQNCKDSRCHCDSEESEEDEWTKTETLERPTIPKLKYPPPVTNLKLNHLQLFTLESRLTKRSSDPSWNDDLVMLVNWAGFTSEVSSEEAKQVDLIGEKEILLFSKHYAQFMEEQQSSEGPSAEVSSSRQCDPEVLCERKMKEIDLDGKIKKEEN